MRMSPIQQRLLEMLRELVELCDEHRITYYAAGGTTLGAIRHKGFIPWDDDVDLMMPRPDWERFVELARNGWLPEGRCLACLELDENYPHVFGRYTDTTSTAIHYNQFLGGGPEGFVVDIFILDPVPNAGAAYAAHREALSLYNDLANAIGYSYPMSSSKKALKHYAKRIEKEGRRAVLDELAAAVGRYDEGEYLVMRWAAAPRLFHKSIFGYPRWEDFEDLRISVPGRCADYLVQHYGDDWMYLPSGEGRITHDAITFPDIDYQTFQDDYLPYIDVDRTRKAILRRRSYHIEHMDELHEAQDIEARACAAFARAVTLKRVDALVANASTKPSSIARADLDWVFGEFYRWQCDSALEGREEYLSIRRYHDPIYIDIGDELLNTALLNLVESNRVGLAGRILRVRMLAKGPTGPELREAVNAIDFVRLPHSLADVGCEKDALDMAEAVLEAYPRNFSNRVFLLELLYRRGEIERLSAIAAEGARLYPEAGEFAKYLADCSYDRAADADEKRAAYDSYAHAVEHTTNGFVSRDVKGKMRRDAALVDERLRDSLRSAFGCAVQEVPGVSLVRSKADVGDKAAYLLTELDDICAENGIDRYLGFTSARLAYTAGNNATGLPALDLFVPAGQIDKLARVILERNRGDRALDCWLTNRNYLSYQLDYVDKTTTFLQVDEGTNINAHGIKVTVIPLRSSAAGRGAAALDLLETGWEINGYQFTKKISAKRAAAAGAVRTAMLVGRKRLSRALHGKLSRAYGSLCEEATIRLPGGQAIVCDAQRFQQADSIEFCGKRYPIARDMRELLARRFGPGWESTEIKPPAGTSLVSADLPYEQLLTVLESEGASLDHLFSLMRKIRMGMLPLANDLRIRNRAMLVAKRSEDRKRWYDYLHERDGQIQQLLAQSDYEALSEVFAGYRSDALRYLKQGLSLCPSKEYLDTLCMLLRESGEDDAAAKLEKLAPEQHFMPIKSANSVS